MSDWNGSENPRMDTRLQGSSLFSIPADTVKDLFINFEFDCDMTGIEFYAKNAELGDTMDFSTEYYVPPLNTWLRYKKFGKGYMVFPNHPTRIILFATTPKVGTRIKITYHNTGSQTVYLAVNRFQFIESQNVKASLGEQGEDW